MSNTHSLNAEERGLSGTGPTRALRRSGMVPGIIYGSGKPQVLISLPEKELRMQYHKKGFLSHMFDIKVGKHQYRALPKDVQIHPVTDEIEHIDFIHVNANEKMKTTISLNFINEAKCIGIKQGGVLSISRHDLEIYCLPGNIPENIEIDVTELNLGQSVHVSDLALPKGVETKLDKNLTIAAIVGGTAEEETAATTEAPAAK